MMSMEKEPPKKPLVERLIPKRDQRLDSVINKLKDQIGASAKWTSEVETNSNLLEKKKCCSCNDNDEIQNEPASDQTGNQDDSSNTDCKPSEDKSLIQSYLMWENNSNLCWLDSSMSLLAHNKTLWHRIEKHSRAQIVNIMNSYKEAISVLNDYGNESGIEERLVKAKVILRKIQESVLEYLKPILKCKEGEPDSAFCSLLNLIAEDKQIKNLFNVEFALVRSCEKCNVTRVRNYKKPIVTLSKVKTFVPNFPVSLCQCTACKSPEQSMNLKYKTLPQCLIFHFENGAGKGEFESLDFEINNRKYKLSGLITLKKSRDLSINHFVTWVRDAATDSWLECNDLNYDILSFSVVPPSINLEDIYIVMYEALDNEGTIPNKPAVVESVLLLDSDDKNEDEDIPVIDLSDELKESDEPKINNLNVLKGDLNEPETNSGKGNEEIFGESKVIKNIFSKEEPEAKEKFSCIGTEIKLSIPSNDATESASITEDKVVLNLKNELSASIGSKVAHASKDSEPYESCATSGTSSVTREFRKKIQKMESKVETAAKENKTKVSNPSKDQFVHPVNKQPVNDLFESSNSMISQMKEIAVAPDEGQPKVLEIQSKTLLSNAPESLTSESVEKEVKPSVSMEKETKTTSELMEKDVKTTSELTEKDIKTTSELMEKDVKTTSESMGKDVKTTFELVEKELKTTPELMEKEVKTASESVEKELKTSSESVEKELKTTSESMEETVKLTSDSVEKEVKKKPESMVKEVKSTSKSALEKDSIHTVPKNQVKKLESRFQSEPPLESQDIEVQLASTNPLKGKHGNAELSTVETQNVSVAPLSKLRSTKIKSNKHSKKKKSIANRYAVKVANGFTQENLEDSCVTSIDLTTKSGKVPSPIKVIANDVIQEIVETDNNITEEGKESIQSPLKVSISKLKEINTENVSISPKDQNYLMKSVIEASSQSASITKFGVIQTNEKPILFKTSDIVSSKFEESEDNNIHTAFHNATASLVKFPLKEVSIKLERLKETEIAKYISPVCARTGVEKYSKSYTQMKDVDSESECLLNNSLEELAKTVVVKSEILDATPFWKRLTKQPSHLKETSLGRKKRGKAAVKTPTECQAPVRSSARIRTRRLAQSAPTLGAGTDETKRSLRSEFEQNRSSSPEKLVSYKSSVKGNMIRNKNRGTQEFNETEYNIQSDKLQTDSNEIASAESKDLPTAPFEEALKINKVNPKTILKRSLSMSSINPSAVSEISSDKQELPTKMTQSGKVPSNALVKSVQIDDLTPSKNSGMKEESPDVVLREYPSKDDIIEGNNAGIGHHSKKLSDDLETHEIKETPDSFSNKVSSPCDASNLGKSSQQILKPPEKNKKRRRTKSISNLEITAEESRTEVPNPIYPRTCMLKPFAKRTRDPVEFEDTKIKRRRTRSGSNTYSSTASRKNTDDEMDSESDPLSRILGTTSDSNHRDSQACVNEKNQNAAVSNDSSFSSSSSQKTLVNPETSVIRRRRTRAGSNTYSSTASRKTTDDEMDSEQDPLSRILSTTSDSTRRDSQACVNEKNKNAAVGNDSSFSSSSQKTLVNPETSVIRRRRTRAGSNTYSSTASRKTTDDEMDSEQDPLSRILDTTPDSNQHYSQSCMNEKNQNLPVAKDSSYSTLSTLKTFVKSETAASCRRKTNHNNNVGENKRVSTSRMKGKTKSKKDKQKKSKQTECDSDCECHNLELHELIDGVTDFFLHSVFTYFKLPGGSGS